MIFAAGDGTRRTPSRPRTGKKVWTNKVSKRGLNTSVVVDGDRLYCSHGLDNLDTHSARPDLLPRPRPTSTTRASPKEVWAIKGIEAAFPTPAVTDKYVYVVDDRAKLYQIDKKTGKQLVEEVGRPHRQGVARVRRRQAVRRRRRRAVLDRQAGREAIGHEGAEQGRARREARPRVRDLRLARDRGRADLPPGGDEAVLHRQEGRRSRETVQIPPLPAEKPAQQGKPAQVQVLPADVALHAGER